MNILPPLNDDLLYQCELDQETRTTLQVHLFRYVKNVEEIRKNILNGLWKCVIIKPGPILHPLQIAVAANKAVVSEKYGTMTTRSVYTEILFNLSLTRNISKSLSKFGIEKDTDMLVCFLISPGKDNSEEILSKIEGEACKICTLPSMRDLDKIRNAYKFQDIKLDLTLQQMLNIIVSRMATKNIISY